MTHLLDLIIIVTMTAIYLSGGTLFSLELIWFYTGHVFKIQRALHIPLVREWTANSLGLRWFACLLCLSAGIVFAIALITNHITW